MQTQPKTTALAQQSCGQLVPAGTPLANDITGQQKLAVRLYQEFHAMKTYGKEPESLESIVPLFQNALARFPVEKVIAALDLYAERNTEFPTRFDIANLIKRNGRPPLKESDIIAIRRKDGSDRTDADWKMLREWEAQQLDGWEDDLDIQLEENLREEIKRLRSRVDYLERENEKLDAIARRATSAPPATRQEITIAQRVENTVASMKSSGCSQADIDEFMESMQ